ncbi:uncharacterized protein zmp:0000000991 isoform X2 [Boleophthalmus pectinirostris]|uniref:uncharacterized protein zmp:0000000991 isoform X2 n=1 Tax=Boleophthalmus pectinirostris TaxID=150288 RepID=UPI00242C2723|nr:uncharacterized protein zmp:0000000991 isoform X2 [Boleophthalmus pectinirostris]
MSTSDAGKPRIGGGGGETHAATPLSSPQTRTHTEREQGETLHSSFVTESKSSHPLNTTKETSTALTFSSKSTKDHTGQTKRPKFTSHFFLKFGSKPGRSGSEPDLHNKETSTDSFDASPVCGKEIFYRVHDLTLHAVDKIPLHLREVKQTQNCISIETSSGDIQSFPNGRRGLLKENASQSGIPAKRPNSVDLNVDKTRAKELLGHSAMLSSTVTVLAPPSVERTTAQEQEGGDRGIRLSGELTELL